MLAPITNVFEAAPALSLGLLVLVLMLIAGEIGSRLRRHLSGLPAPEKADEETQEGYIVSGVVGLLALLLGFTFSMSVDRFEARRGLVLEEANAIGTTYLRTQLLGEPHRERISRLLVAYTDNRVAMAGAGSAEKVRPLLATNDQLITDLWAATSSAFLSIKGLDFSSSYLDSMNNVIDLDTARKAARMVRVPAEVFVALVIYMAVTAGVLGFVLAGPRVRRSAAFMYLLLTLSFVLIVDIDDPARGGVKEGQGPMEMLQRSLKNRPPPVFDKFRIEDSKTPPSSDRGPDWPGLPGAQPGSRPGG